jgi:FAD:protein FMN transferase
VHDGVGQALLSANLATGVGRAGATDRQSAGVTAGVPVGPSDGASRFERRAMGSPLRLTVVGVDAARAAAGWAEVSAAIEEIEQALSRFRATSDLVRLNEAAGDPAGMSVHPRLVAALAAAERARRMTGGAFDPRILRDLERLGYVGVPLEILANTAPPAPGSTASLGVAGPAAADGVTGAVAPGGVAGTAAADGFARPGAGAVAPGGTRPTFADGLWLHCDPRESRAAVAAPVDLGGIGKGLAIRWAGKVLAATLPELREPGTGALLEAGGDLIARGVAPQGGPWMVAIEDPAGGEEPAIVALRDGAICTSSIGVHRWRTDDGRDVHHLLDPRTGEPGGAGLASVTVSGPDPAWAEVWSKALFLEGAARIGPRARAMGLAAWWVREDGSLEMTPAARQRTAWVRSEA